MAVYRVKIEGIKPLLIRDKSRSKALDQLVKMDALTGEEMADALAAGETVYKPGDRVEAVEEEKAGEAAPGKEAAPAKAE